MDNEISGECLFVERVKERDKVGVWGFGNVSRDVVLSLVDQGLGKKSSSMEGLSKNTPTGQAPGSQT